MGTRHTDAKGPKKPAKAAAAGPRADKKTGATGETVDYRRLFEELVGRANQGEKLAVTRLRAFLDVNPWLWRRAGDLSAAAERAWIDLVVGADAFKSESVRRRLAELKEQLRGPSPTPLESMLVDLVTASWLAVQHADIALASPAGASLGQAAFRLKRAESAQKRFLTVTKTLATLRALLPEGLVPTQPVRLYDPESKLG